MCRVWYHALAFLLLVAAFTHSNGKRFRGGGRHTYPSSHGHSGSGARHSYPSSDGLSGLGGGHTQHSPHTYPQSPGLSGNSKPGAGHSYPHSPGNSGNGHSYPGSHGSRQQVQHAYVYIPPQQIHYTPTHGTPVHYPVYQGSPPIYVQNFHNSGSQFSTLLTGLALYNLGRSVSHGSRHSSGSQRSDAPGERCTLRIEEDRNLQTVKIPCYIMSTFTNVNSVNEALNDTVNSTVATTTRSANASVKHAEVTTPAVYTAAIANDTATASTTINATLLLKGTEGSVTQPERSTPVALAPVPTSALSENTTTMATPAVKSQILVTTPEPVKPEDVKGEPVKLGSRARCFVERVTPTSTSRTEVDCGLLQQYAMQSMHRQPRTNAADKATATGLVMFVATFFHLIV